MVYAFRLGDWTNWRLDALARGERRSAASATLAAIAAWDAKTEPAPRVESSPYRESAGGDPLFYPPSRSGVNVRTGPCQRRSRADRVKKIFRIDRPPAHGYKSRS